MAVGAESEKALRRYQPSPSNLCVLIVEDSDADAYLIRRALSCHPSVSTVVHASDGLEAQAMIARGDVLPDLAFIDLQMPRFNGFDLLVALSSTADRYFPMVVLTTSSLASDRLLSQIRGAIRVITKPDSAEQLDELLNDCISDVFSSGRAVKAGGVTSKVVTGALRETFVKSGPPRPLAHGRTPARLRAGPVSRPATTKAHVSAWEMDFAAERTLFSPRLRKRLGAPVLAMPICGWLRLWIPSDRPAFIQAFDQRIASGAPLKFEGRSSVQGGSTRWWRLLGEPLFVEGRCVALRGQARDVTRLRTPHVSRDVRSLTHVKTSAPLAWLEREIARLSSSVRTAGALAGKIAWFRRRWT